MDRAPEMAPAAALDRTSDQAAPVTPPGRASVARNMAYLMSSQLVTWVLGTALTVVQPRFLGPEGLGQLRLAYSLWTIAQVFIAFGTSTYLMLEMARDRGRGTALVGPVMVLRLAGFACTVPLMAVYAAIAGLTGQQLALLVVVGATTLCFLVGDLLTAALTGLEQMSYPAIANVVSKTLLTITAIVVLFAGGGPVAVAAVATVNTFLAVVLLAYFYRGFGRLSFGSMPLRRIARASSGFLISAGILVIYQQVDTVVMSLLVDERALGWYSTADAMFSSLLFVPTIMMASLFPVIGRLHTHDPVERDRWVLRSFSLLLVTGVPIGLGAMVVAAPFSVLLFGDEFVETGPVLAVLGVVTVLVYLTILLGQVAIATGRVRFWNVLMACGVVMSIGLDVVLVPWADDRYGNGAIGGAVAYLVTESMMLIVGIWRVAPFLANPRSLARSARVLVAGAAMVAAAWPLRDQFLLVPVVVGATVYTAVIVILKVPTDDERDMLRRIGTRFGLPRPPRASAVPTEPDSE